MTKHYFFLTILFLLVYSLFPTRVSADTSQSYFVTDAFQAPPPSVIGVGRIYFSKSLNIDYQSGRFYLSQKSDGTGTADISDGLQIIFYGQYGNVRYNFTFNPNCRNDEHIIPPLDLTHYLAKGYNRVEIRLLDWCGLPKNVSSLYFVNNYIKEYGPQFLDLPWDYTSKGQSFDTAALSMTSYFDHEYPLLSSGLQEPDHDGKIVTFAGLKTDKSYSSHDGYDYASPSYLKMGDPVLAAAGGNATYINTCGACGNMIVIDHGNGYQTRYMHMQKDGLISTTPGVTIPVSNRQQIGKMGATGNVWPQGDAGAHIHFMVVQDKNNDGKFNDNIPDGVTDPFGWQSMQNDPWKELTFTYGGKTRQGNKSVYLWKNTIPSVLKPLSPIGDTITMSNLKLVFSTNSVNNTYALEVTPTSPDIDPDDTMFPLSSTFITNIKDAFGNVINTLSNYATFQFDFSQTDLAHTNQSSLGIYSSSDGITWSPEAASTLDMTTKKATLATMQLQPYYMLMAEKKDTIAPITESVIAENSSEDSISLTLHPTDNENGVGIDYTMYKINDLEWEKYEGNPLLFTEHGTYNIQFYTADKSANIETIKTVTFVLPIGTPTPSVTPPVEPTIAVTIHPTISPTIQPTIYIEPTEIPTTPLPTRKYHPFPKLIPWRPYKLIPMFFNLKKTPMLQTQ